MIYRLRAICRKSEKISAYYILSTEKYGSTLVSVNGKASEKSMEELFLRLEKPTIILCLSDLSQRSAFFAQDLATTIGKSRPPESNVDIRVKCIGLLPEQVLELKIPMVRVSPDCKENKDKFKRYLKSHTLDPKKMVELDALEVYYPGGIAGFLDECLYHINATSIRTTKRCTPA